LLTPEEGLEFGPENPGEATEFDHREIAVGDVTLKLADAALAEIRRLLKCENGIRHNAKS